VQVSFDQASLSGLARQQGGASPGNDQLAQQIDHRVKPVGLHADIAIFTRCVVPDFLLLAQRGLHHLVGNACLGLQQAPQLICRHRRHAGTVFLVVQHLRQLVLRDGPNRHQHVPQARCLWQLLNFAHQLLSRCLGRNDIKLAVLNDKTERAFDLLPSGGRLEFHAKTQITGFGVQVEQGRYAFGAAAHGLYRAHSAEVPRNRERVHAVAKRLGAKSGRNGPLIQASLRSGLSGRRIGSGRLSLPA